MIDPKLYSLIEVAEAGSFTRAADHLSLTQPAVSQHIRLLEEELHVKIFDRSHNELHLTREGKLVLRYARRVVALRNNLERSLMDEKGRVTSLTVGITHTAESNAIAESLASYAASQDGLTIKVITDSVNNLRFMLKNYELDFMFAEGRINDTSLNHLMLDTDCLILAVAPNHHLAKQGMVTIGQIKKENLILRNASSNTRNLFVSSLESQNMSIKEFNVILEIDNIATIKDLIRRGFGVSVLAKSTCLDELRKRKIAALTIENFSMMREINIVYANDFEHLEILHAIIREYHSLINEHGKHSSLSSAN